LLQSFVDAAKQPLRKELVPLVPMQTEEPVRDWQCRRPGRRGRSAARALSLDVRISAGDGERGRLFGIGSVRRRWILGGIAGILR
jgi:hypothetical protein